jgi:tetratricopeptide (TPR) repeat protein
VAGVADEALSTPNEDTAAADLVAFARSRAVRAAVKANDEERVADLVSKDPSLLASRDLEGNTLLHIAAHTQTPGMALLLLSKGAAVDARDKTGHTPLHLAAHRASREMMVLLLSNRADVAALCGSRQAPLHKAASFGNTDGVELLLEAGASVNQGDKDGDTPLHCAAANGKVEVAATLLDWGAAIDARNRAEQTPLHVAAQKGRQEMVALLAARNANLRALTPGAEYALDLAGRSKHPAVVRQLRELMQPASRVRPAKFGAVAVLPFGGAGLGANDVHWRTTLARLLTDSLGEVDQLRLVDTQSAMAACRRVGLLPGQVPTQEQAGAVGELVEATRVIYGQLAPKGGGWEVKAGLLRVTGRRMLAKASASGTDWHGLRDRLLDRLGPKLGLAARGAAGWGEPVARTPAGLACFGRAWAAELGHRPVPEIVAELRKALAAEPASFHLRFGLAAKLFESGDRAECQRLCREMIRDFPGEAEPHLVLGVLASVESNPEQIEREMRQAFRFAPEEPEVLSRLSQFYGLQDRWEQALFYALEAQWAQPENASVRSVVGRCYAHLRDTERARQELRLATLQAPEDLGTIQMAILAYDTLGDIPRALQECEHFLAMLRAREMDARFISVFEERAGQFRRLLTGEAVEAVWPKEYPPEELSRELANRLTPSEARLAVNPLAGNEAMSRWAAAICQGATNDLGRARVLFETLIQRVRGSQDGGIRTAREVYAAWDDPVTDFNCQEYAKLYVVLARAVGLKACQVHLNRDCFGEIVYHDCAAVMADGKVWLVDPAYRWFGVHHQSWLPMDDLESVAHQLFQPKGGEDMVARCRAAVKLDRASAWGRVHLGRALRSAGRLREAAEALDEADRLEPGRWDALTQRGMLAADRGRTDEAEALFRKSIEAAPHATETLYALGVLLSQKKQWTEARDRLKEASWYAPTRLQHEQALRALAEVNTALERTQANAGPDASVPLGQR